VCAAMVDDPAHYRWSSYPANALGQRDPLITPHPLYTALAADEASRQACYRALDRDTEIVQTIGNLHD
jgi:putative transposase